MMIEEEKQKFTNAIQMVRLALYKGRDGGASMLQIISDPKIEKEKINELYFKIELKCVSTPKAAQELIKNLKVIRNICAENKDAQNYVNDVVNEVTELKSIQNFYDNDTDKFQKKVLNKKLSTNSGPNNHAK
jgi:hypothetical protein